MIILFKSLHLSRLLKKHMLVLPNTERGELKSTTFILDMLFLPLVLSGFDAYILKLVFRCTHLGSLCHDELTLLKLFNALL